MSTECRQILSPYMTAVLDNYYQAEKADRGKVGAVVRDRTAFYIANKYGTSFHHIRNYIDVNSPFIRIIKSFIDDDIDYSTVRDYAKQNRKELYDLVHLQTNHKDHLCYMIKPKNGSKFLQVTNEEIVEVDMEHATTVDYFMSNELTHEIVKRLLNDNGYHENFILVKCKNPHCHVKSEFKEIVLNG